MSASPSVDLELGLSRCPFCHQQVAAEAPGWVCCRRCLARHHAPCWEEGGRCSACGGDGVLEARERPAPRRRRRGPLLVLGLLLGAAVGLDAVIDALAAPPSARDAWDPPSRLDPGRRAEAELVEARAAAATAWEKADRAAARERRLRAELRVLQEAAAKDEAYPEAPPRSGVLPGAPGRVVAVPWLAGVTLRVNEVHRGHAHVAVASYGLDVAAGILDGPDAEVGFAVGRQPWVVELAGPVRQDGAVPLRLRQVPASEPASPRPRAATSAR